MQNALINVNGRISAPDQATVSVFDRSYLYGDSLYEVARSLKGQFLHLDEHLTRLEKSAALLHMSLGQSTQVYAAQMERTFAEFRNLPGNANLDVYCRLIVSRGQGRIGFGLNCLETPTLFTIIVQPLVLPTEKQLKTGLKLRIVERLRNDPRSSDPAAKTGNYLNSLLAYLEGTSEGFDDALMLNADAHVTEGTTFNIGYIRSGIIATPPLDIGILDGITRQEMISAARELGLEVREVRFPRERLYEADEVFVTSTLKDVFPVTTVDDRRIARGKAGPLTLRLRDAVQARARQHIRGGGSLGARDGA